MKKNVIINFLGFFLLCISCNKNNYKEIIITKSKEINLYPSGGVATNNYFGTYKGYSPCPDCKQKTVVSLTLNQDNTYKLKSQKENECIIERGTYYTDNKVIILNNGSKFDLDLKNKLYRLKGHVDKSNNNHYVLNKID